MTAAPRFATADHHDPWTTTYWQDDAACAVTVANPIHPAEPSWWDVSEPDESTPTGNNTDAIDVCTTCTVVSQCMASADPRLDLFSIRGGRMPADWMADGRRDAA